MNFNNQHAMRSTETCTPTKKIKPESACSNDNTNSLTTTLLKQTSNFFPKSITITTKHTTWQPCKCFFMSHHCLHIETKYTKVHEEAFTNSKHQWMVHETEEHSNSEKLGKSSLNIGTYHKKLGVFSMCNKHSKFIYW